MMMKLLDCAYRGMCDNWGKYGSHLGVDTIRKHSQDNERRRDEE